MDTVHNNLMKNIFQAKKLRGVIKEVAQKKKESSIICIDQQIRFAADQGEHSLLTQGIVEYTEFVVDYFRSSGYIVVPIKEAEGYRLALDWSGND